MLKMTPCYFACHPSPTQEFENFAFQLLLRNQSV